MWELYDENKLSEVGLKIFRSVREHWTLIRNDPSKKPDVWFKVDLWDLLLKPAWIISLEPYGGFCYGFVETSDLTLRLWSPI